MAINKISIGYPGNCFGGASLRGLESRSELAPNAV